MRPRILLWACLFAIISVVAGAPFASALTQQDVFNMGASYYSVDPTNGGSCASGSSADLTAAGGGLWTTPGTVDNQVAQAVFNALVDMGFSGAGASGALGAAYHETLWENASSIDASNSPVMVTNPFGYTGIFQWGGGRFSGTPKTLDGEIALVESELNGAYSAVKQHVGQVDNTPQGVVIAAHYWVYHYEAPVSGPTYNGQPAPKYDDGYGAPAEYWQYDAATAAQTAYVTFSYTGNNTDLAGKAASQIPADLTKLGAASSASGGAASSSSASACSNSASGVATGTIAQVAQTMGNWGGTYQWGGGHGTLADLQQRIAAQFQGGTTYVQQCGSYGCATKPNVNGVDCAGFIRAVIYQATGHDIGAANAYDIASDPADFKIDPNQSNPQAGDFGLRSGHVLVFQSLGSGGKFNASEAEDEKDGIQNTGFQLLSDYIYYQYIGPNQNSNQ